MSSHSERERIWKPQKEVSLFLGLNGGSYPFSRVALTQEFSLQQSWYKNNRRPQRSGGDLLRVLSNRGFLGAVGSLPRGRLCILVGILANSYSPSEAEFFCKIREIMCLSPRSSEH